MSEIKSIKERLKYPTVFNSYDNPCLNCISAPICKHTSKIWTMIRHLEKPEPEPTIEDVNKEFETYIKLVHDSYDYENILAVYNETEEYIDGRRKKLEKLFGDDWGDLLIFKEYGNPDEDEVYNYFENVLWKDIYQSKKKLKDKWIELNIGNNTMTETMLHYLKRISVPNRLYVDCMSGDCLYRIEFYYYSFYHCYGDDIQINVINEDKFKDTLDLIHNSGIFN